MKKIVSILAIILVCGLALAAFTGIFKMAKDNSDDKTSETTDITTDNSTVEEPEADAWTFIIDDYNDFEAVSFDVDFISNGEKFVRIYAEDTNGENIDGGCLYYVREDGSTVQICDYWNCLGEDYVAIEIIPNQDLSEEFITWLEKYAISGYFTMISFKVDDLTLSCLEGMTWGEFIDSDYNNNNFERSVDFQGFVGVTLGEILYSVYYEDYSEVNDTDVIIPNHNYVLQE